PQLSASPLVILSFYSQVSHQAIHTARFHIEKTFTSGSTTPHVLADGLQSLDTPLPNPLYGRGE
ncbi:MAG: hypothetical protein ACTH7C_02510, partial [Cobetia marina]